MFWLWAKIRTWSIRFWPCLRFRGTTPRASTARTIVADVRDFDPDVIIMDTAMPGTSGCDAAREVRQHRHGKRPVLIALAGHHPKDLAEISGYDYSFGRPLDTKVLFKLVASRPTK